jgi:hypothetical protein
MNWLIANQRDSRQDTWPVLGGFVAEDREPLNRTQLLRRLEWLTNILDDRYQVPGTKLRFGWDTLIGLIPIAGDGVTTLMSVYFMWEAHRIGISKWTLWRMLGNVGIDFVVGAVPLVGDIADVAWRANRKNLKLLKKELARDLAAVETSHCEI